MDATATAAVVRSGEVSAAEMVDAAIARAEALNPTLNAIIEPDFDGARRRAGAATDGPLAGVPTALKDLFCPGEGEPAYSANRILKERDHRYTFSGNVARRFAGAGAISLGRTHSPEFGTGNCTASAETALYGPTRNPWDPNRTAMGSSGGAAAAVASGIVPIAHASDGGGSIRIPASACGLVGMKATRGRISAAPAGEVWAGGVTDGALVRSVRDAALALDVLAGPEIGDPYPIAEPARPYCEELAADPGSLRIGVCTALSYTPTDPECVAAVEAAANTLEALGHRVELAQPEPIDRLDYMYDYMTVIRADLVVELDRVEREIDRPWSEADLEPGTWYHYRRGQDITAAAYVASKERLHAFTRAMLAWWADGFDILLTPTLATPPPPIGHLVEGEVDQRTERVGATIPYTPQANVTGQPAMSLPLHESDAGIPIGVQFIADVGGEDLLIRLASQLESAMPWADRRPQVFLL